MYIRMIQWIGKIINQKYRFIKKLLKILLI